MNWSNCKLVLGLLSLIVVYLFLFICESSFSVNVTKTWLKTVVQMENAVLETNNTVDNMIVKQSFRSLPVNDHVDKYKLQQQNVTDVNLACDVEVVVSKTPVHLNGFYTTKKHPIEFASTYRNPCWYENLTQSDIGSLRQNPYLSVRKRLFIKRQLLQLADIYEEHLKLKKTYRLRCLPLFHIIGQVKCGTTDLFHRLSKHNRIHMGVMKEPDWWTRARLGIYSKLKEKSTVSLKSYVDLFGLAAIAMEREKLANNCNLPAVNFSDCSHSIIGDASVATFSDNILSASKPIKDLEENVDYGAASNMKWLLPDAKIIVMVREPTARLFSDYLFFHEKGVSQDDFHNRVIKTLRVFNKCKTRFGSDYCVREHSVKSQFKTNIHFGMYSIYLREWLRVFNSSEQLLVVRMEDYAKDAVGMLKMIFKFLKICNPTKEIWDLILNDGIKNYGTRRIGPMWNETRHLLNEFYASYNEDLSKLLNDGKYLWKDHICC